MKLKRLKIEGFRGVPVTLDLRLDERSLCLLAENGHGKTTIVDALEFWSSRDLEHYHREGYRLDAAVNVDSGFAVVTCEATGQPPLARRLEKDGQVGDLAPAGPIALGTVPPPLPILRHRTMTDFMDKSPGEKKDHLLRLFGLAPLTEFRRVLKSATNSADKAFKNARANLKEAHASLDAMLNGRPLVDVAEEHRVRAGLLGAIGSVDALLGMTFDRAPSSQSPDRVKLVDRVVRARSKIGESPRKAWNELTESRAVAAAEGMKALLASGERAIALWDQDSCPLCLLPKDRRALADEIAARLQEFRALGDELAGARVELTEHRDGVVAYQTALKALAEVPPPDGWPDAADLAAVLSELDDYVAAASRALSDGRSIGATGLSRDPHTDILQAAAERAATGDERHRSLASLVRIQERALEVRRATKQTTEARAVSDALTATLQITDRKIGEAIEAAVERIGQRTAQYYQRLVASNTYDDVRIEYTSSRSGGVEFTLRYDGRHVVRPPQRIMSESQLNALGLALFLAQQKLDEQVWRTLVLDDVVNSFDSNHRQGLARLLDEEFADWQVIMVTHDRMFVRLARPTLTGWRHLEVAAWTPAGGPVLADGSPREQLSVALREGRAATTLGGLARAALEQGLTLPLEKLGLELRYDPHARYGAHEYLVALRRGLRTRSSPLADLPVLRRMEAENYVVNVGAHDRPADPGITSEELRRLVDDLTELDAAFTCSACGERVWAATLNHGRRHQCRCSALAV